MKNVINRIVVAACAIGFFGIANATVTFSNIVVTGDAAIIGTEGNGWHKFTSCSDIDFMFDKAFVGDDQPTRITTINITFEVECKDEIAKAGNVIFSDDLAITSMFRGSGFMHFQEVIEDFTPNSGGGIIGSFAATYNGSDPFIANIPFDRPATHIKVKKTIVLSAIPDTEAIDLAAIGIVEQHFECVPEPASMAALGLGVAAIAARRRRKS